MQASNRPDGGGQGVLLFAFAVALAVIVLSVVTNPGSADKPGRPWEFSKEAKQERHRSITSATPEHIDLGKQLYVVNCAHCHTAGGGADYVVLRLQGEGLKFTSTSEVDLYRTITNGLRDTTMGRGDYLNFAARWAIVHYLRSLTQSPKSSSSGDWSALEKEGI